MTNQQPVSLGSRDKLISRFARPRSFMALILTGFMVVAMPLFAGLIISSVQVGRVSRFTQHALFESSQATQVGQLLVEQVAAMERSARQFMVLGDPSLFETYANLHKEFEKLVERMHVLRQGQRQQLGNLLERERRIFFTLNEHELQSEDAAEAVKEFETLLLHGQAILDENNNLVGQQMDAMRRMAGRAQRLLFWQALALIPIAVGLAGLFFVLIMRPVRAIDNEIRRLGAGEFSYPIRVTGPKDLEELGERLDWLRARLCEVEQQKRQFLHHISHELKTPLAAVREGAELLTEKVLGPLNGQQAEVAEILQHNTLRLQHLIEDLLEFNRLAGARGDVRVTDKVHLDRLVRDVLHDYKLPVRRKKLRTHFALTPVTMHGDRSRLATVVDNLLSNAVKYSPVGGDIDITLTAERSRVLLEIRDSGPGVIPSERARIFDAFYQGKSQPLGPVKGTGLGLALVKECVHAHGGNIEIVDNTRGAHFRVTFPLPSREIAA